KMQDRSFSPPPRESALGSLLHAITLEPKENFQPTNINFGLFPAAPEKMKKDLKKSFILDRAKQAFLQWLQQEPAFTHVENSQVELKSQQL
ncbi:hypothetical protein K2X05_01805, partial [bacterium]|nr:hypothetical protein [bacterium]